MALNLLEQLADLEVPPPPAQFDNQLHERVNRSLLTWQLVDLLIHALPWTMLHFGRAAAGLFAYTLTGRYEPLGKKRRRSSGL
jgi:hypothetical protein